MKIFKNKKAQAILEYVALIILVFGVWLVFRKYIDQGLYGRMKGVGDSFGLGRLYDPKKTIECTFDSATNKYYSEECFEANCAEVCFGVDANDQTCNSCKVTCQNFATTTGGSNTCNG